MTTMTLPVAFPSSKPQHVAALRATWRRSAEHFAEQAKRFLRLTVLAALPSLLNLLQGGKFDTRTLVAFVVPFAEVAYRELFPALGAAAADTAPGVTIIPTEVGADEQSTEDPPAAAPPDPTPEPVPLVVDDGPVRLDDIPLDLAA